MTNMISEHISYDEAVRSNTAKRKGIRNIPNPDQLGNMKRLAENVFEPIRKHFNSPIRINSFYRSGALNKAIGGSSTSQHCLGQAIDIDDTYGGFKNMDVVYWVQENLSFDQMIIEYPVNGEPQWVHISYVSDFQNRKRILVAKRISGKTTYLNWDGTNHK
jgi:zinc D-Ala-D-Ala carboxypeptidase